MPRHWERRRGTAGLLLGAALLLLMPGQAGAQRRAPGQACPDGQIVTGTVLGRAQLQQHGRILPPEFVRSAGILAAVQETAQRERLHLATIDRLRRQGFPQDEIDTLFSLVYRDAVAGVSAADTTRGILGGVAAGVAGLALFGNAKDAADMAGAGARGTARMGARVIRDKPDQDVLSFIDAIIAEPCRMTPDEAIAQLARR